MAKKPSVEPACRCLPGSRRGATARGLRRPMLRPLVAAMAAASWGVAPPAQAQLPTGPMVVNGSASIVTAGNRMTVTNGPNAIVDWQSFSIGAANGVHFQQPGAASRILNRVTGNDPSQILGSLSSNGKVWLINPHGVLFGQNARIDVAGLVASTLAVSNADFLAGRFGFAAGGNAGPGTVTNQGEIRTTFGGHVWLLGDQVRNEGLIQAPGGGIVLAAGRSVELVDSGLPNVIVRVTAPGNEAVNLGTLAADGGHIDVHGGIVNQDGIVRADRVAAGPAGAVVLKAGADVALAQGSTTQAMGGTVRVEAGGTVNHSGEIVGTDVALAADQLLQQGRITAPGGSVAMTAATTTYLDGAVDVSDPQGTGGSIRLATGKLEGMAGGSLRADGRHGGGVQVTGRGMVAFSSTLSATGREEGGSVEVSGDSVYLLNAKVDASGGARGGTVHLGGGWQGGGELPHAREVLVGVGSEVRANGAAGGQGGEVVVWSTQSSEHYGALQAQGGGRIELSSQGEIRQTGTLEAGAGGSVLFDPKNLIITDSPPDSIALARKVTSGSVPSAQPAPPALADGDFLGAAVALDGDRLAVGAPGDDTGGTDTGAVHLFTGVGTGFAGLTWQKKLASGIGAEGMPFIASGSLFGSAVALDGDRLAVGAPRADTDDFANGAVHLFTGVGSDFSGLAWRGQLASQTGAVGMPPLTIYNDFGRAIALKGDRLVVGAPGAFPGEDLGNRSAVHLFTGVGADFSGLTWRGSVASGTGAIGMPAVAEGDFFGKAVALQGDLLAVGAPAGGSDAGTVHLFTGAGSDFSGLAWRGRLASGSGAIGMPVLAVGDGFGSAVALNGGRLAVGAPGDGGASRGAVHLFAGAGTDFSKLAWQKKLASGSGASGMPVLADGDLFGSAVALDGDRLAVGASNDGTGGIGRGATYLFNGLATFGSGAVGVSDTTFAANPSGTSYITPAAIETLLDDGTAVTLQANNDVTVQSPVTAANASGNGGTFTLQAGRNLTVLANVTTDNGNLVAIAGDTGANPSFRDAGTPTLAIADGVTLDVGTGTATLAAVGGNVVNIAGDAAVSTAGAGRWLIYAANPADSTEGFSAFNKHYDQPFTPGSAPSYAGSGNWFLYAVAPTLSVTPGSQSIVYGSATPAFTVSVAGFIDGDTAATSGLGSTATWNVGGARSSSGALAVGGHDVSYAGGLVSSLGYRIAANPASSNDLLVTAKPLTAIYTAGGKVYDGTTAATVAGSSADIVAGDTVGFSQTASFRDKNAGSGKTIDVGNIALGGADAGNYALRNGTATTTADIAAKPLTLTLVGTVSKVYDGTVAATPAPGNVSLAGVVPGDVVGASVTSASYDTKNVGASKSVSVTGISLTGADAGNYSSNPVILSSIGTITPAPLTASYTGSNKTYDGTTAATVAGSSADIVAGDTVGFSQTASFRDKNAGSGKTIDVGNIALGGADAGNYALRNGTATASADITPKTLSLTPAGTISKVYDGTVAAPGIVGLAGVVAGDDVGTGGVNAAYADKNAGTGKTVSVTSGLVGADAGNYRVPAASFASIGTIVPAPLIASYAGSNKTYDGTTTATVAGSSADIVAGDAVGFSQTASFRDKNAGIGKVVDVGNIALGGADAGNYALQNGTATTTADIAARPLTLTLAGTVNKVYDGTATAALVPANVSLVGAELNDAVEASVNGAVYDSRNVGTGKAVSVVAAGLIGADAGNYRLALSASSNIGTITPAPLSYVADAKTGTVSAPLPSLTGSVTGFVGTDTLADSTTGTLAWTTPAASASSLAGTYPVEGSGLTAINYSFTQAAGNATALTLVAPAGPEVPQTVASVTLQGAESAVRAALPTLAPERTGGAVSDTSMVAMMPLASKFEAVNLALMTRDEMQTLLVARKEFMKKLLFNALYKLEQDPSLAEVRPCPALADVSSGLCMMTPDQRRQLSLKEEARHNMRKVKAATLPQIERKVVVLFGINRYSDPTIPPLENAVPDAEVVGRLFTDKLGYEARVVKNATKADIFRTLNELAAEVDANDSVIVYYAGHGYQDEKTGAGYWVPSDGSASDPARWISNADISKMLSQIPAKQVAMISDSCYSGAFTKEEKIASTGTDVRPSEVLAKRSVVVMSSGGDEPVADSGKGGHSIFAWQLMQALGNVANWQSGNSVFEQVRREVSRSFPQTPQYGAAASAGHQAGGEYLFEVRQLEETRN